MTKRIVIVGAGIAGLAAARGAADSARGSDIEILLLESSPTVGGKAKTIRRGGWLLEAGPTGYLDSEPLMDTLVKAAGLTKIAADDAAARRFLVRNGRLKEIKASPPAFLTSGILSPLGVMRIATELFRKKLSDPSGNTVDESVWDFAARRLGPQAADRLIAPMVLGVFAGDAKRTSLPAAFPRMAELERDYGSLIKALVALKTERGRESGGPAGPSGKLTSFAAGLEELPRALAERGQAAGDFQVRTSTRVHSLGHDGLRWHLAVEHAESGLQSIEADAVILATEPHIAARLVKEDAPDIAAELTAIPMPPVAVVGLGYGPKALAKAPRGFGALIQRGGGLRILGVLWDTHLFPERSPDGTILMRCMIGGATDTASGDLSDQELVAITKHDLAKLHQLGSEEPCFTEVIRYGHAIPQYEVGHLNRVRRIREHLKGLNEVTPGLSLAGNYLDGVAFAKSAKVGYEAGKMRAEELLVRKADVLG